MAWWQRFFQKQAQREVSLETFAPVPEGGYVIARAVRDVLLERPIGHIDWLVPEPKDAAQYAETQLQNSILEGVDGVWRVVNDDVVRTYAKLEPDLNAVLETQVFTIHAMALDAQGTLLDPFNGQADLKNGLVRAVNLELLQKDALQMLRAVRCATQLGFRIESKTQNAMKTSTKENLSHLAGKVVGEELNHLILGEHAGVGFQTLTDLGLLELYLPDLAKASGVTQGGVHHLDVLGHSIEALHQLIQGFPEADLALRWATLFHDIGKPDTKTYYDHPTGQRYHFYGHDKRGGEIARDVLERLHLSPEQIERVSQLVRYHMLQLPKEDKAARRFARKRRDLLPDLLKLMLADREAARGPMSSEASRNHYRMAMARVLAAMKEAPEKPPLLDGNEVMTLLKLSAGKEIGQALTFLKAAEAAGDVQTKDEARQALEHYAAKQGW